MDGERAKAVGSIGSSSTAHVRPLLSKSRFRTGDEYEPSYSNHIPRTRTSAAPNDAIDLSDGSDRSTVALVAGNAPIGSTASTNTGFQCIGLGVFALLAT